MKPELDKTLCEKYPKMFVNRNKPMNETCMCWGFEHGDGWYNIIDTLCEALTYTFTTSIEVDAERGKAWSIEPYVWETDSQPRYFLEVEAPQVVVDQVKEKFGTLRFYYHLEFEPRFRELAYGEKSIPEARKIADHYSNFMDGIVHYAEVLSARTCEETGLPGEMHVGGGWYRTLNPEYARTNEDCKQRNFVPANSPVRRSTIVDEETSTSEEPQNDS